MQTNKALNEIVTKEVTKAIMESIEKIELINFTELFFNQNYSHIKEVYKNDEDKDDDQKLFLRVKSNIEEILAFTRPTYGGLSRDSSVDPKKLGMLSEWVDWAGSDEPGKGYAALVNSKGQEIIDGWNAYRTKNKIEN